MRNLYFQRSEWEHYRISDEYMLIDILLIGNDVEFLEVCLAMSQSRGTRVIQEWITGQQSKLSLVTSGLRIFLDYGGGIRVHRKGLHRCKL